MTMMITDMSITIIMMSIGTPMTGARPFTAIMIQRHMPLRYGKFRLPGRFLPTMMPMPPPTGNGLRNGGSQRII